MLYFWISDTYDSLAALAGILFAFGATIYMIHRLQGFLPKDAGREFAHDGKLSAGKPRGAGILFIFCFVASALLFSPLSAENIIYMILLAAGMMTGFLDDCSKMPWGEYKKGFLDLCVSALTAATFLKYNPGTVVLALFQVQIEIPPALFAVLGTALVWVSVNVTNCADGVDGLSGTLALISLMTTYAVNCLLGVGGDFSLLILLFAACILGYLWYNAMPSRLLMGDAGSRAMGMFIAIAVLKTGSPLLYIPIALALILDGGLGLVKVALLRFLKIRIFKNTRMPLHDHVRKVWGWSNTQTVFRFAIVQLILAAAVICGLQQTAG